MGEAALGKRKGRGGSGRLYRGRGVWRTPGHGAGRRRIRLCLGRSKQRRKGERKTSLTSGPHAAAALASGARRQRHSAWAGWPGATLRRNGPARGFGPRTEGERRKERGGRCWARPWARPRREMRRGRKREQAGLKQERGKKRFSFLIFQTNFQMYFQIKSEFCFQILISICKYFKYLYFVKEFQNTPLNIILINNSYFEKLDLKPIYKPFVKFINIFQTFLNKL